VEFLSFSHCLYWKDGKGATPEETFYTILSSYSSLFSTIPSGKIPSILQDIGTEIEGVVWERGRMGDLPGSLLVNSENCTETLYVFSFRKFRLDPSVV